MLNKNNEEVVVMEQTTFIQRHAKKILFAGGVVVAAGAYYILHKHHVEIKNITDNFNAKIEADKIQLAALDAALLDTLEDKNTLMEAASEGLFEEAISKVANKINYRRDRKEYLEKALEKCPDDVDLKMAYEKVVGELAMLYKRKDKFIDAQAIFEIKNIEEL